jgi:hypothetical protein
VLGTGFLPTVHQNDPVRRCVKVEGTGNQLPSNGQGPRRCQTHSSVTSSIGTRCLH